MFFGKVLSPNLATCFPLLKASRWQSQGSGHPYFLPLEKVTSGDDPGACPVCYPEQWEEVAGVLGIWPRNHFCVGDLSEGRMAAEPFIWVWGVWVGPEGQEPGESQRTSPGSEIS